MIDVSVFFLFLIFFNSKLEVGSANKGIEFEAGIYAHVDSVAMVLFL